MSPGASEKPASQPAPRDRGDNQEQPDGVAGIGAVLDQELQPCYYLSVRYPDANTAQGAFREITRTLSGSATSVFHLDDPDSSAQMIVIISDMEGLLDVIARIDVLGQDARDWQPDPDLLDELIDARRR